MSGRRKHQDDLAAMGVASQKSCARFGRCAHVASIKQTQLVLVSAVGHRFATRLGVDVALKMAEQFGEILRKWRLEHGATQDGTS